MDSVGRRLRKRDKRRGGAMNYKYINFSIREEGGYVCRNNKSGDELGIVILYKPWRQWCFIPTEPSVYSIDCLVDIIDFINKGVEL